MRMTDFSHPISAEAAMAARFKRVLLFLRRRWWIPVGIAVVVMGGQTAWVLTRPESHTGVARMWVGGKVRLQEGSLFSEEWQNFFGTQTELMQSEKIRRRVLQVMKGRPGDMGPVPIRVEVSQPRKTTIFNLTAEAPDAAYLEAYLNAVMDEYLKYRREVRASSSDDTVASLGEQLEKVEREIKADQDQLALIQRTNNITVLQEVSVSAGNQLNKLNLQLADLKLEADLLALVSPEEQLEKEAEAATLSMRRALGESSLSAGAAPLSAASAQKDFFAARQQRDLKRVEEKEMGATLRPEHPTMIRLKEEIARLEALMEIYRKQSTEQLEGARDTLRLKIRAVEDAIRTCEPRVVDANDRLAQYKRSRMNLERLEGMQSRLLQAMHSVDVNKSVDQETVSIMDKAAVFPTPRRLPFKISLAALVGLTLGLGVVLLLEQRDQRILSIEEARANIPARLLGCLPNLAPRKSTAPLRMIRPEDDRTLFVEALRNVRAALWSLWSERGARIIMVTSALPDEGKTTVSANLAAALAFSGANVLLIDGDLRRGTLHKTVGLSATPGLADLMASERSAEDCYQRTDIPRLTFLANGILSDSSGELCGQQQFVQLLHRARERFDYVVVDTSPVLVAADVCAIVNRMDAVLFVLRSRSTTLPMARQAIEQLREHNAPVITTVLNRVEPRSKEYPYHRYTAATPRETPDPGSATPSAAGVTP